MKTFKQLFPQAKPVIGMVHVRALPGTPFYEGDFEAIAKIAVKEARQLSDAGIDGIMLENMHDIPYLNGTAGHEISTAMAVLAYQVRKAINIPCGLQILASANEAALAAAKAAGLDFIRAEGFVFGHVADEGYIDASAGPLLRYRRQIDADNILVLTDIKKKHSSHAITADIDLMETAKAAEFFRSDGLIVTGTSTGAAASLEDLEQMRGATSLPVLVGSGITNYNLRDYYPLVDGFIVGSHFKEDGNWRKPIDPKRVSDLMEQVQVLRNTKS